MSKGPTGLANGKQRLRFGEHLRLSVTPSGLEDAVVSNRISYTVIGNLIRLQFRPKDLLPLDYLMSAP